MSFFSSIGNFFKKVFGSEAAWERIASATITVIAPLTETIIALTAGEPASAALAAVIEQIQNDLAAVNAVVTTAGSSTVDVNSLLTSIEVNLQTLLTAGQIKNPATLAQVTAIVDMLLGEIKAITSIIPPKA